MHTTDPGQGQPLQTVNLTQNALNDLAPRIAIGADGDSWVAWWRDSATDAVLYRRRDHATGSWGSETQVSEPSESSRHPEVAGDDSSTWITYEAALGGDTAVAVTGIQDHVEPFPTRTILATTSYPGDVDVLIHVESGNVWVTWVDSASAVGWSEYDYPTDTWSVPGFESYASDTVAAARSRIRTTVLGN